ncbi:MAG: methyltransferase FkbM [Solirubrobacterales bacterium]|nr:methyltransferase FkbM [Solirubrobacterales bacterium]
MRDAGRLKRLRRSSSVLAHAFAERLAPEGELVRSFSARDAKGIPIDLRLGHLLDWRGGFFVEAGANDGLFQSNTALLERSFEWDGVLVEPSTTACEQARRNRTAPVYNCALVAADFGAATVTGDFDGYPMGSVGGARLGRQGAYTVPARTLQSILDERGVSHVDFLSLDAEGYELQILQGVDFTQTTFSFMLIELYPENQAPAVAYLGEAGYQLVANYSGYNRSDNPQWDGTHNDYLFARAGLQLGER